MFKRENRLIPSIRFNNSFLFTTPQFIFKEKKNGLAVNRFGIIVSKKIDKRAVERNRIKRIFRVILLSLEQKTNTGHDILLIIKKGAIDKSLEENTLVIEQALTKAGIFIK
jgi:ribonuclease P protein component